MRDWPPSNYPIFLALVLLAATAVTLAMGDEKRAEQLAIYAYYLLVIGVAIRFFELALPGNTVQKLRSFKDEVKLPHIHISLPDKHLEMVSDVSRNGLFLYHCSF